MSENVHHLITLSSPSIQSVAQRIERRITVLSLWQKDGVPPYQVVPSSLNEARKWHDVDLEILPIGSASDFAMTHPIHGKRIQLIQKLLEELMQYQARPRKVRGSRNGAATSKLVSSQEVAADRIERSKMEQQLVTAVSQWHAERDQRLAEKRRADSAEGRSIQLLHENAQKDTIISDLRRQLSASSTLKVVK